MSKWEGFAELVAVVDCGGFSAAARVLGVSKSHVSQQVSRLEERLNTRLLHRTTRKLSLTETGSLYYAHARQVVEELEAADAAVTSLQQEVKGELRIAAPHLIGEAVLVPALAAFTARHPQLQVDLHLAGHQVDLVEQRFDLAIQMGAVARGSHIRRPLARTRFHVVASPDYLAAYGSPQEPSELAGHRCLQFVAEGFHKPWRFHGRQGVIDVKINPSWRSNSGHVLRLAAEAGQGLAYLPDYYLQQALDAGRLRVVLEEWPAVEREIVALCQHRRHLSSKLSRLIDHLSQYFSRQMGVAVKM